MLVNNKRYEAAFYQKSENTEMADANKLVWFMISKNNLGYKKYQLIIYYENGYNEANGQDL